MLWYKKAEHKSEISYIMVLDNQSTGGFHIMLYINYIQELLKLQEVLVKNVSNTHFFTIIDIEMPVSVHTCPHCGSHTSYIHDYRHQLIRDCLLSSTTDVDATAVLTAANASPSIILLSLVITA